MNGRSIVGLLVVVVGSIVVANIAIAVTGNFAFGFWLSVLALAVGGYWAGRHNVKEAPGKTPPGWTEEAWKQYRREKE